ncbi:hypothetical protein [Salinimicrobium sp. GXAS 041]|uniref:hypothetical protein n=1 Tax=Salinimicrobium sp. GXAS 041 TaxID=3400806 RepID=UPI003C729A60
MSKINKYFLIGTFGMAANSSLHILIGSFLSEEFIDTTSAFLYFVFAVFLIIGTTIMIKRKRNQQVSA